MTWQPIETAPKDGTQVDLWAYCKTHDEWVRRTNCAWETITNWTGENYYGWSGWANLHCSFDAPTHWMPIPAPPEGT